MLSTTNYAYTYYYGTNKNHNAIYHYYTYTYYYGTNKYHNAIYHKLRIHLLLWYQ